MAMKLQLPARLSFRLSETDDAKLRSRAAAKGVSRSALARKLVVHGLDSKTHYPNGRTQQNADELRSINARLGRMTGLTNQIAVKANSGKTIDAVALKALQNDVAQMRQDLRIALDVNRVDP